MRNSNISVYDGRNYSGYSVYNGYDEQYPPQRRPRRRFNREKYLARRRQVIRNRIIAAVILLLLIGLIAFGIHSLVKKFFPGDKGAEKLETQTEELTYASSVASAGSAAEGENAGGDLESGPSIEMTAPRDDAGSSSLASEVQTGEDYGSYIHNKNVEEALGVDESYGMNRQFGPINEEDEAATDLGGSDDSGAYSPDGVSEGAVSSNGKIYKYEKTGETKSITSDQVISDYALLIDCDKNEVIADRGGEERMYPASMTKILTVLVAAEQLGDMSRLDDKVALNQTQSNYVYSNDCSAVGFSLDEEVPVKDLFYGTILPSGADAAVMLAEYIAGSHEAFVDLMNQKCRDLGIGDTCHFTNCVGLYDDNHYCTLEDMAVILNAAMDNELARKALSEKRYTTAQTEQHPDGIEISNLFLRRIEDKDTGGDVIAAKTGFVNQSGNCAASYFKSKDGKNMICVTGGGNSSWRAIYDHVAVYNIYGIGNTGYVRGS